jgi:hypothetical protein
MAVFQLVDTSLPIRRDGTIKVKVMKSDGTWFEKDIAPLTNFTVDDPRVIKILRLDPKYKEQK